MSIASGPLVVSSGLVLEVDAANPKSYSPNVIPNPTDIYGWCGTAGSNNSTISRDTTVAPSPANGIPLKMAVTGNDPYIGSYSSSTWNLAPASNGQTWTASCYVRASAATVAGFFIFGANSSGTYIQLNANQVAITTEWTRITLSYTISDPLVAYVQLRLDGPDSGGTGINIWWDGLQLELGSSATTFNPMANLNGANWYDVSGTNNKGTLYNTPVYNTTNLGIMTFNGSTTYSLVPDNSTLTSTSALTIDAWVNSTDVTTRYNAIVGKGSSDADEEYCVMVGNGTVYFDVGIGSGPYTQPSYSFANNTWYNVTAVHSRTAGTSTLTIYVNGVALSGTTINATNAPNDNSLPVSIGRRFYNGDPNSNTLNGKLGPVRIYNTALSASNVLQNFNAMCGRYGI